MAVLQAKLLQILIQLLSFNHSVLDVESRRDFFELHKSTCFVPVVLYKVDRLLKVKSSLFILLQLCLQHRDHILLELSKGGPSTDLNLKERNDIGLKHLPLEVVVYLEVEDTLLVVDSSLVRVKIDHLREHLQLILYTRLSPPEELLNSRHLDPLQLLVYLPLYYSPSQYLVARIPGAESLESEFREDDEVLVVVDSILESVLMAFFDQRLVVDQLLPLLSNSKDTPVSLEVDVVLPRVPELLLDNKELRVRLGKLYFDGLFDVSLVVQD